MLLQHSEEDHWVLCEVEQSDLIMMSYIALLQYQNREIPYSLKFSRIRYFADWPPSAQKQTFADKIIFVVERAYPHIMIAWAKFSRDKFSRVMAVKIFNLENFRLYGSTSALHSIME